jgi:hypothetical protein
MTNLFFWLGTTGGFGILLLLALTSIAVVAFFAQDGRGESLWARLISPIIAAALLTLLVVLAVQNYATLLGVPAGNAASWILPASYGLVFVVGLAWGSLLKARRPQLYSAIGLGAYAATGQLKPATTEPVQ